MIKGIAIGILALALAACNSVADVKPGTDVSKKSELTIQEVLQKAQEASEKQKSMHADMDIGQIIELSSDDTTIESNIKMKMDAVLEPLAMYQIMQMDMGAEGSMEMEMYMTEDGFFMKDPESESWMKLPSEMFAMVEDSMATNANPTLDLAMFEKYADDFKFEQNDTEYILTIAAAGDKFKDLMKDTMASNGVTEGMTEELEDVLKNMKIHGLDYEIFIDKKTFNTSAFNMDMDMEMTVEGETTRIKQKIKAEISQINELKEVIVPQEILDSAVEQSF
jgi:hypothetical protein